MDIIKAEQKLIIDGLQRLAQEKDRIREEVDRLKVIARTATGSSASSARKKIKALSDETDSLILRERQLEEQFLRSLETERRSLGSDPGPVEPDRRPVVEAKRPRVIGRAAVAYVGVGGMVAIALASYAGWPDVVNNALRAMNVHVPDLEHVSFAQTVVYLVIISATTIWLVRALRNRSDE